MHVPDAKRKTLHPLILDNTAPGTHLMTDILPSYRGMARHMRHDMVNHEIEFVRGDVHTQGIESYWAIVKRGLYGTFHHVGRDYLGHYLNEFDYRFNSRKVSDAARFSALMAQPQGRVLWFCETPQPENPFA